MTIQDRDGNILENVLGVGMVPHRRGDECVNDRLREHPCAGKSFIVGYCHKYLSDARARRRASDLTSTMKSRADTKA